jgi:hypothetical protein
MPDALPSPLPKWAKTLLRVQEFLVPAYATDLVDYEGLIGNVLADVSNQWRRFVFSWQRIGDVETADIQYTTFDVVNITGGLVDNTWTAADYTTCQNAFDHVQGYVLQQMISSGVQATGYKVYRMAFAPLPAVPPTPPDRDHPFAPTGPPDKVSVTAVPGGIAANAPPQTALTSTDKTAYPRHWGRNYWPFTPVAGNIGADQQALSPIVDGLATALHQTYDELMAAEFFPVVPVTQFNKLPARALLTVNNIQVDSNIDVVRRRRAKATRYRKQL